MGKKFRNLMQAVTEPENIVRAYIATARGRRMTLGALEFKEYADLNLEALRRELIEGTYRQGPMREFTVFEPKPRLISALSFRDRVAQHALVNVIGPIFEATLLPRTFACRAGMGTHAGVRALQSELRALRRKNSPVYVLKTDFSKYFPSIDRARLHTLIEKKISCPATLALVREMVPNTGHGLPIGCLTSQLFANVYGGVVDRFIHFDCGRRNWFRYMDDVVVLGDNSAELVALKDRMGHYCADALGLRFSHWSVFPAARGVNFLGYRVWADYKLLRKSSVTRARRKLAWLSTQGKNNDGEKFIASWGGHTRWANAHHLLMSLNVAHDEVGWECSKIPPWPERETLQSPRDPRWWC